LSDPLLVRPAVVTIDPTTAPGPEFSHPYTKVLRDLRGVYRDVQAFDALLETSADEVVYEVSSTPPQERAGELIVGTSVVRPGKVGDEFAMTRGHLHRIPGRAEMYFAMAGHGVMLLESLDGEVEALEMRAGQMVYVPGGWIHRSVNVGTGSLVMLFTYAADAGQDYAVIERSHGMAKLVVDDGHGAWVLRENPDYIPRIAS
jgi:glucose-6-phosphate isomerase